MYKKILFILIFHSLIFNSQIPGLINYDQEDGLISSFTYQMVQDNKGFIWIGSDSGLFRFDGKEFTQYNKNNGLKNINILTCQPLHDGEIFIIPFLKDFAYLKNGRIINSEMNKELKKLQFEHNPAVLGNKDSLIFYNASNPKNIFVYKDGRVKNTPLFINDAIKDAIYALTFDFRTHLLYFRNKKGEILAYDIYGKKETICTISPNILLSGTERILFKKNFVLIENTGKIDVYYLKNKYHLKKIQTFYIKEKIFQFDVDKNNKLWVCLEDGGVLYFDKSLGNTHNSSPPVKFLENYIINSILVDNDNNVWFSTKNNGIYFIAEKFFKNYINLPLKNNSAYITSIATNGKDVFLGYNEAKGGIFHQNTITDFILEKNRKAEHEAIYANDKIAIFGLSASIHLYNLISKKKNLINGKYNLKNIVPYTANSVLLCTSNTLTEYNFVKNKSTDLLKERSYTALPYAKDSLFVGDFKDLYKFSTATRKKALFLEGYYFTDIKKWKENAYIGATSLNGIIIFNNRKILRKITEKEHLAASHIKKIEVENENVFWASTNSGLSRIELKGNVVHINNFTQTDGLPSNIVGGCVIKKDTIYIGTSKGLGVFSIKKLLAQQKNINKKVIINSVTIGGKVVFDLTKKLTGESPNTDVIFNLSFPDYMSQGKISYLYKIQELNNSWQTSTSSKIIFNSIPPGKYTFRVFGIGYNGEKSYSSTDLSFEIKPKFWQTWWFKALLVLLTVGILVFIINLYLQKQRNKKLEVLVYEKKIAELELQAIKAQINPHFIYNCLNSIQFLLYKKDYQETENYLDIFAQMIRKTLHYSEKTFMPIQEEVEYLTLYLDMEKLRLKEKFDYEIIVSNVVDPTWIIPSLLIQPFVENAIKHGVSNLKDRKGNIRVIFDYNEQNQLLSIEIEDNGMGIISNSEIIKKINSFGVKLTRKRIDTFKQLFNTDIALEVINLSEIENRPGTKIKILITQYENTNLHHR